MIVADFEVYNNTIEKSTSTRLLLTAVAVVDEISPLEMRLFATADRVVNDEDDEAGGGGETAFDDVRFCTFVIGGFCFNSPSGIISSFSLVEQLKHAFD